MNDFNIVDVPGILSTPVATYDGDGNQITNDGEWHRQAAETQYVLAEFLAAKGMVVGRTAIDRSPTLTIKFSALTPEGQVFAREAVHKWLVSMDRPTAKINDSGLEKRWQKFKAKPA
ncbi:hypothetical protein ACFOKF_11545 [Sphingobium rhizovicinum]|uniref:Uncharacterized protein n=1 Tax=Sphingobium rhizovicinum TaxID=432308 RepID=A0ABV7NH74_9SPHN